MKRRGVVMYEVREYGTAMWGDDVRQTWLFNTEPAEQPWRPRKRATWRYWESSAWQDLLRRLAARPAPQQVIWSDHSEPYTQNHAYRFDASRAARLSEHAPGAAAELVRAEARLLARIYTDARIAEARRQREPLIRPGDGS